MVNQTIIMIYENYVEEMSAASVAEAKHLGGLSRMFTGKQSEKQALLPVFDSKLAAELNRLFGQGSDSAEVRELAEWMLAQSTAYQNDPPIKYSFMAVHRHLIPLVESLNSGDSALLLKEYEAAIPRRERFPIHTELFTKLKKQAQK